MSAEADELFTLDPDEFVAARDAIVRRLKKEGAKDEAAEVARLRRPTVAAWALNVVAREHPDEVAAVLEAGERLREAQEEALRGDASALRTATAERRDAVAAVTALVAGVLGDRAPAQAGAVSATLEAATVDPEVAGLLRAGRLDKERSAAAAGFGFGDVGDWTPPPPRPAARKPAAKEPKKAARSTLTVAEPAKPEPPKPDARLREELDAAVAEARSRATELHEAEQSLNQAKKELADATRRVREARTRANKAELHAEQLRQRVWELGERRR